MIDHQEEESPTYVLSYPRRVRLVRFGLAALLIIAALVRWALVWIAFLRPIVLYARNSSHAIDMLNGQPLRPLISAHLGLILVAGAVAFIYDFLPDLSLSDKGLAMRSILGWNAIPWQTIKAVRIAKLEESERRLILIQGSWSRWSPGPRLVSVCLGGGFSPGLFFTSDIHEFAPLIGRIYRETSQAVPDVIFDDEFFALPARIALEPNPSLEGLVAQARDEAWPVGLSAQAMAAVAGGLLFSQVLILILFGGAWWKLPAILGLCGLEWMIGALYLFGLTEVFPAHYEFQDGLLLYPMAQIPRALLSLPMAMFVAASLPFVGAMIGLAGVLWAVTLTIFLVQQMYHFKSIMPAMVGAMLQAIFQFIILAIALT